MENEGHELQSVQSLFNMSLQFSMLDDSVDEYAKITKVWEKSAHGEPNHSQHYIEIVFTPGQSLVSNEKPEDYSVPVFFMHSVAWLHQHGSMENFRTV